MRPAADAARDHPPPKFTEGSTMRHVAVMTATGSIGLMAIFVVDFLNLFYISLLGQTELAAAIGYAGTVLFFSTSVCIGIAIACTALVSRALGARDRDRARRLAASSLVYMGAIAGALSLASLPFLDELLALLGASGRTHEIALRFLWMVQPATPLLGLGMAAAGILRAVGDAGRAMWVTLAGGLVTAVLDPILIFGLGLGVDGAAIASVASRATLVAVGFSAAIRVHDLIARPRLSDLAAHARPLAAIALPAVLTNVATPVGNGFVTAAFAGFGDAAVAAWAVIGRLVPLAFGPVFALSGAIGPIFGQNIGARRHDRVRAALGDSLVLTVGYTVSVWALLALLRWPIANLFGLSGEGAALAAFFCLWIAGLFVFNGMLFVANAVFNNLGFATYSTAFNWGRATLGTIPFVWLGADVAGAKGVLAGQAIGGVVFGIAAVIVAYWVVRRLGHGDAPPGPPMAGPPLPPFASGKAATAAE